MSYTDILLADNWTNFSNDPIPPSSGIYAIGFNILTSSATLSSLDYLQIQIIMFPLQVIRHIFAI
jgi:hypothetical protein